MVIHQKILLKEIIVFKAPIFRSAVGIPQGSVISPVLCNMYTSDSVPDIVNNHAEFADDTSVLEV